jgi:hypothetical protein
VTPIQDQILALQAFQLFHDDNYHRDIVMLPIALRLKHMGLHQAKYAGGFFTATNDNGEITDRPRIEKLLVDAFTITLSTANILNQNLGQAISKDIEENYNKLCQKSPVEAQLSISALCGAYFFMVPGGIHVAGEETGWFARRFTIECGRIAKACEAIDHMEDLAFRRQIADANLAQLKLIFAMCWDLQLDLELRYIARMREIEARNIFDTVIQAVMPAAAKLEIVR